MNETVLLAIKTCKDHLSGPPCYTRGLIVLTEEGPKFAMHSGVNMLGPQIECGYDGCKAACSVRRATAGDIPDELVTADQAARVLGLAVDDWGNADRAFRAQAKQDLADGTWHGPGGKGPTVGICIKRDLSRRAFQEAALRVRGAEQAKTGGEG